MNNHGSGAISNKIYECRCVVRLVDEYECMYARTYVCMYIYIYIYIYICYCYYLKVGRCKRVVNDDEDPGLLVRHLADGSDVSYSHQGVAGAFYPNHL